MLIQCLPAAIKVAVVNVRLATNVTAGGTTDAGHLVASNILHKALATAMTFSQHGLGHTLLNECAHVCLILFLHFFALQGHMVGLPA